MLQQSVTVVLHYNGFSEKLQTLKYSPSSTIDLCPVLDVMTGSPHFIPIFMKIIRSGEALVYGKRVMPVCTIGDTPKGNEKRKLFLHS